MLETHEGDRPPHEDPDVEVFVIIARLMHALLGGSVTYIASYWLLDLSVEEAKVNAVLTAGVAYYTASAAGKVTDGLNLIYRYLVARFGKVEANEIMEELKQEEVERHH